MNDLANVANIMVGRDTDKQWLYQEYRRTYDARVEDQDTYNCNSLLVYCHGSLIEDGTQAELAIIYYCGVRPSCCVRHSFLSFLSGLLQDHLGNKGHSRQNPDQCVHGRWWPCGTLGFMARTSLMLII